MTVRGIVVSCVLLAVGVFARAPSPPWRTSLDTCWKDPSCRRALIVSHGGAWNLSAPYDSMPAFIGAYELLSDAVKGDFRVSSDNIGMVMHSSPIEWYESPGCSGKKVEENTAAELMKCKMEFTSETFISVPELLAWAKDKVIVMLCVKRSQDIARAISTLIENNATNRAFLEIHVGDMRDLVPTLPNWDQVYYVAEGGSAADLDTTIAMKSRPRAIMFEFDDGAEKWGINITQSIEEKLHPNGVRALEPTNKLLPTVDDSLNLFHRGIDVVYTYNTANSVQARTKVDIERGIYPP